MFINFTILRNKTSLAQHALCAYVLRSHEVVVDKTRRSGCTPEMRGKTADRMYNLFLFQQMKMLIFSTLIHSMAVFTLAEKKTHKENVLDDI